MRPVSAVKFDCVECGTDCVEKGSIEPFRDEISFWRIRRGLFLCAFLIVESSFNRCPRIFFVIIRYKQFRSSAEFTSEIVKLGLNRYGDFCLVKIGMAAVNLVLTSRNFTK